MPKSGRVGRSVDLRLLAISGVVLVVLTVGVFTLHQFRQRQLASFLAGRADLLAQREEWHEADFYLQKYLALRPEDYSARLKLVENARELTEQTGDRAYLIRLLFETVGFPSPTAVEERPRLKQLLAEQLLLDEQYGRAEDQIEDLEKLGAPGRSLAAKRVKALATLRQIPGQGVIDESERHAKLDSVLPSLDDALSHSPGDTELALAVAHLYQGLALRASTEDEAVIAVSEANRRINRMVAERPKDAEALVVRYRYRKQYGVDGAIQDLKAAHQLDGGHYEASLLLAFETLERSQRESESSASQAVKNAKELLGAAIEIRPDRQDAYLAFAQLHWKLGERDEAIKVLGEAQQHVRNELVEVRFLLGDYALALDDVDGASAVVGLIKQELESLATRMTSYGRTLLNNRLRLLEARVSARRGDVVAALAHYNSISSSFESASGEVEAERSGALLAIEWQASRGSAELLAGLGRWDQVGRQLSGLAERLELQMAVPSSRGAKDEERLSIISNLSREYRGARVQAAEAFFRAGQHAEAVRQLDAATKYAGTAEKTPPQDALELRLLIELGIQLDALPGDRNWKEFQFLLSRAEEELPISEPLSAARVQYLLTRAKEGAVESGIVRDQIQQTLERFSASPSIWWLAAQTYLELGDDDDAAVAAERYLVLEQSEQLRASRWVEYLVGAGRRSDARDWVASQLSAADDNLKPLLQRLEIRLLASQDGDEDALDKARKLAKSSREKESLVLAMEIAIAEKDWATAEQLEEGLADVSTVASGELEYYRALRMLATYETLAYKQRRELEAIARDLSNRRPNWHKAAEVSARLAEVQGDEPLAIQGYERAVSLGDRRASTLERLALHLFRAERYDEAQQVVDRLRATGGTLSQTTESLAIGTALKQQRLVDAARLARESVAEHPDDPARKLWLYHVLVLSGETGEAEILLDEAREMSPGSVVYWKAQFDHFVRSKRLEEARQLLEELPPSIARDKAKKSLALAVGYEALGDFTRARTNYHEAVQARPKQVAARLRYAALLLKTDAVAAREQYEAVLRLESSNAEAKRRLAALLAATGDPAVWGRIDELLSATGGSSDPLDKRLRAVLLSRRGKSVEERTSHCELARRILLGVVESSDSVAQDTDRLLLASVYEQEGILKNDPASFESARSQIEYLLSKQGGQEKYQGHYVNFLLRSIDSLNAMANADEIRSAFVADAHRQVDRLEQQLINTHAADDPVQQLSLLGLRTRLLNSEGRIPEAKSDLKEFASRYVLSEQDQVLRAKLVLRLGAIYSAIGAHADAEPWYRELMKAAPGADLLLSKSLAEQGKTEDAVNLILQNQSKILSADRAAVLATILSASETDPYALEKAWPAVLGALDENSEDVELLMAVAVLQVTRGNQDEAISLFRQVLDVDPNHALALNNLATLLGENSEGRKEALSLISRALRVAGRSPALLDTQGTIQLQDGDAEAAISSLEESVATVDVDPRYYFHLAAAYWQGGEKEKAVDAFARARRRGIDKTVLTAADKQLMKELEAGLGVAQEHSKNAT